MRRRVEQRSIRGRRGALGGASAAVVCLGAVLVACAGGGEGAGDGYVAVQRPSPSVKAVPPTGDVELVPLKGDSASNGTPGSGSSAPPDDARSSGGGTGSSASGSAGAQGGPRDDTQSGAQDGAQGSGGRTNPSPSSDDGGTGDAGGGGGGTAGGSGSGSDPATPAGPAVLAVGDPERGPADERWCEKVTVTFHNTGGTAVRSGTVTFGTHVIGALGIDWATVESTERLPVPIAPGSREKKTWTVCVDAWRVPLGMHVETRDVSVRWE
ncbi:hypothetical protein ACLVWQ_32070 (plasmid) [Streptomyces sp. CWNU-52B]|uniref:hypothetical protein n=1 Tax=unclassified Streptomyces TaxID=2593676 RepID=UPI0039C48B75